jgi:hypothetical protein
VRLPNYSISFADNIPFHLLIIGALMIKFSQGFAATGIYEEGYSPRVVNWLLISSAAAVAIGGCYTVYQSVSKNLNADIDTFTARRTHMTKQDVIGEEGGGEQHEEDEEEEEAMEQSSDPKRDNLVDQHDKPSQDIKAIEINKVMI